MRPKVRPVYFVLIPIYTYLPVQDSNELSPSFQSSVLARSDSMMTQTESNTSMHESDDGESAVPTKRRWPPRLSESSTHRPLLSPIASSSGEEQNCDGGNFPHSDALRWSMDLQDWSLVEFELDEKGNLSAASLDYLVERMTPFEETVDPEFASTFFATFRMFTTPLNLFSAVHCRYRLMLMPPPDDNSESHWQKWQQKKGATFRFRVVHFIKQWLEFYWRPLSDNEILHSLLQFVEHELDAIYPDDAAVVKEFITLRRQQTEAVEPPRSRNAHPIPPPKTPTSPFLSLFGPSISKLWASKSRGIPLRHMDPLQLAQQLTIIASASFCYVPAVEILYNCDIVRLEECTNAKLQIALSMTAAVTQWVSNSIFEENNKRNKVDTVKVFIKISVVRSNSKTVGVILTVFL